MKKYYIKLPSRNALKSYIRLKIRRTHLWLKTIIIVIHDKDIAAKCRRVIEIADGRIVSDSKSK